MFYQPKTKKVIFIADMEHNIRELVRRWMLDEGLRAESFQDASSCLSEAQRSHPDVLLLDMLTASTAGGDVLHRVREIDETIPVILLYHDRLMESALQGIRDGAYDFHAKPLERFRLCVCVKNAAKQRILELENSMLKSALEKHSAAPPSKGDISMKDLEKQAIQNTLIAVKGNVSKAARVLGVGRTTLYRKMSSYGIEDSKRILGEETPRYGIEDAEHIFVKDDTPSIS
jgi:DNA-binding NtrC family response regulator